MAANPGFLLEHLRTVLRSVTFALSLASACLLSFDVFAAPPTQTSVEELLRVTRSESLLDAMLKQIEASVRQGMLSAARGKQITAEQQRLIDTAPAKLAAVMREEMSWEKLRPMMVDIYRESFDQEEVDGLIKFYKSPVGQRYLNKMPVVMQKSMLATQQMVQTYGPKLQAAMQAALEEARLDQ